MHLWEGSANDLLLATKHIIKAMAFLGLSAVEKLWGKGLGEVPDAHGQAQERPFTKEATGVVLGWVGQLGIP